MGDVYRVSAPSEEEFLWLPSGSVVVDNYGERWEKQGRLWRLEGTHTVLTGPELWSARRMLHLLTPYRGGEDLK